MAWIHDKNFLKAMGFIYFNKILREMGKFPYLQSLKNIKCLRINWVRQTHFLYKGNDQILLKEIKEDLNKWKAYLLDKGS